MRNIRNRRLIIFIGVVLCFSCKKDDNHGYVHVVVKYKNQILSQPIIYMKAGTLKKPNIPLSQYDKYMGGDALGQATFEDVAPGNYYFYAEGYSSSINTGYSSSSTILITGGKNVTVISRWRGNIYELSIDAH